MSCSLAVHVASGGLSGKPSAVKRAVVDQLPEVVNKAAAHQHLESGRVVALPEVDADLEEKRARGLAWLEDAGVQIQRATLGKDIARLNTPQGDHEVPAADISH